MPIVSGVYLRTDRVRCLSRCMPTTPQARSFSRLQLQLTLEHTSSSLYTILEAPITSMAPAFVYPGLVTLFLGLVALLHHIRHLCVATLATVSRTSASIILLHAGPARHAIRSDASHPHRDAATIWPGCTSGTKRTSRLRS